jgi:hypothetical protein
VLLRPQSVEESKLSIQHFDGVSTPEAGYPIDSIENSMGMEFGNLFAIETGDGGEHHDLPISPAGSDGS